MVIAIAVVVTVALVPVAAAYLQLGSVATDGRIDRSTPVEPVMRGLSQSVAGAESEVAGAYGWSERERAVDSIHNWLDPRLDGLEARHEPGTQAVSISYNQTLADAVASNECPRGDGRVFGPCTASRGVVVQERDGEAVVVAVALDVQVVSADTQTETSRAYRP